MALNVTSKKIKKTTRISLTSLFVLSTLIACTHQPEQNNTLTNAKTTSAKQALSSRNIEIWPALDLSKDQDTALETKVQTLLATMSLEQKVAQMIQPEIRDFTVDDMRRYGFGSYLNGGGAFPNNDKHATPKDWVNLAEDMYQASIDDSLDGSSIPALWGTDAVHGHNNVIGATLFPHNIGLGAANNPELIEKIAEATAREVMATGIDWVFAPTVAVVRNDRWGRTYEGYSEDPEIVKSYSSAIVRGLQGRLDDDFLGNSRVISTVKHFLGDGGTQNGVDQGNNTDNEQTLFNIHAQGYVEGLSAGAQSVMASFNSWQGKKMHGHKYLLTDVLKKRMGFDGFVVGDWLGHGQIPGCTNYNCSATINAGLDIFMASGDTWKPLLENTISQVKSGEIPLSRIDDAVSRILRVKLRAGLFEKPSPANRLLSGKANIIGAAEHRAIARQAVRESLVLLKNKNSILPLNPKQRILVAGDAADNIGKQSGGWTITWQGTNNTNKDFPGGTSIYDGLKKAVTEAGGEITLSTDGDFETVPDVAIVVFGEEPYAEGVGDVKNIDYQSATKTDLALLQKLKSKGIPTVAIFISGRPMYVNAELNASDAFVAAWLPGSEGIGVSDLLLTNAQGEQYYDFKGRLSYSWPASPNQASVNRHDTHQTPLLPYGFGLSYDPKLNKGLNVLSNNLDVEILATENSTNTVFFKKKVQEPYTATVHDGKQSIEMTSNMLTANGLTVRTIDKDVQEDARQLTFSGNKNSAFLISTQSTIDLSEQLKEGQSLFLNLKVESQIQASVTISMVCEDACDASLDITKELKKMALNEWQEMNVSLACFEKAGVNLKQVLSPFKISSSTPLIISLSEVSIRSTPNVDECN